MLLSITKVAKFIENHAKNSVKSQLYEANIPKAGVKRPKLMRFEPVCGAIHLGNKLHAKRCHALHCLLNYALNALELLV